MRHLISLDGWNRDALLDLFARADGFARGGPVARIEGGGSAALFFPPASLRTRVSFETGVSEMGLQPVVFPPETLDKSEDLGDVAHYLAQWASVAVVRHPDITVPQRLAAANALPVVNAMTELNHPCEVLSDLYALSRSRGGADIFRLRYLFVGPDGNIGRAWAEAARAFGLELRQSAPAILRIPRVPCEEDLEAAIRTADVVITDGPGPRERALAPYRITAELLDLAPDGVHFDPCPPFVRGREVSADAIEHPAFVGHAFKRALKPVQQAIVEWALDARREPESSVAA